MYYSEKVLLQILTKHIFCSSINYTNVLAYIQQLQKHQKTGKLQITTHMSMLRLAAVMNSVSWVCFL